MPHIFRAHIYSNVLVLALSYLVETGQVQGFGNPKRILEKLAELNNKGIIKSEMRESEWETAVDKICGRGLEYSDVDNDIIRQALDYLQTSVISIVPDKTNGYDFAIGTEEELRNPTVTCTKFLLWDLFLALNLAEITEEYKKKEDFEKEFSERLVSIQQTYRTGSHDHPFLEGVPVHNARLSIQQQRIKQATSQEKQLQTKTSKQTSTYRYTKVVGFFRRIFDDRPTFLPWPIVFFLPFITSRERTGTSAIKFEAAIFASTPPIVPQTSELPAITTQEDSPDAAQETAFEKVITVGVSPTSNPVSRIDEKGGLKWSPSHLETLPEGESNSKTDIPDSEVSGGRRRQKLANDDPQLGTEDSIDIDIEVPAGKSPVSSQSIAHQVPEAIKQNYQAESLVEEDLITTEETVIDTPSPEGDFNVGNDDPDMQIPHLPTDDGDPDGGRVEDPGNPTLISNNDDPAGSSTQYPHDSNRPKRFFDAAGSQHEILIEAGDVIEITNFGGIGHGNQPSAETLAKLTTLIFSGDDLKAENMILLTQNNDLIITFKADNPPTVILKDFELQNLDNLSGVGNILFDDDSHVEDSFDVWNTEWEDGTVFNNDSVTVLNDLDNTVQGREGSHDLVRGLKGDDRISGLSGNDTLDGGEGNDTLLGNSGDDTLVGDLGDDLIDGGSGSNIATGGDGRDLFVLQLGGTIIVTDYTLEDSFVLADDLSFEDLDISEGIHNGQTATFLVHRTSNQPLGILLDIEAHALSPDRFITDNSSANTGDGI